MPQPALALALDVYILARLGMTALQSNSPFNLTEFEQRTGILKRLPPGGSYLCYACQGGGEVAGTRKA